VTPRKVHCEPQRRYGKSVHGMSGNKLRQVLSRLQQNGRRHELAGIRYRYAGPNPATVAVAESRQKETAIRRGSDQRRGDGRITGEEFKIVTGLGG
jgi:hypothetical protein